MKNINVKKLLLYIFITLLIGTLPSIFVFGNMDSYSLLNKPLLSSPGIVFPIAWTIIYILMGISIYRIMRSDNKKKNDAKLIYFIQLVINALWTVIFFGFNEYFLSFLWIIMLILLVITMMIVFYKIDKVSANLNILYLVWLLFASYLNFGIFVLN